MLGWKSKEKTDKYFNTSMFGKPSTINSIVKINSRESYFEQLMSARIDY